jgi:hypothetical protein
MWVRTSVEREKTELKEENVGSKEFRWKTFGRTYE